jgi:hypothetical protein
VDRGHHRDELTGTIMGAFMSYVLVPQEHDTTRLLLKIVMRTARWAAPGLSVGDLIMARRQLLNRKQLAERHQAHLRGITFREVAEGGRGPARELRNLGGCGSARRRACA